MPERHLKSTASEKPRLPQGQERLLVDLQFINDERVLGPVQIDAAFPADIRSSAPIGITDRCLSLQTTLALSCDIDKEVSFQARKLIPDRFAYDMVLITDVYAGGWYLGHFTLDDGEEIEFRNQIELVKPKEDRERFAALTEKLKHLKAYDYIRPGISLFKNEDGNPQIGIKPLNDRPIFFAQRDPTSENRYQPYRLRHGSEQIEPEVAKDYPVKVHIVDKARKRVERTIYVRHAESQYPGGVWFITEPYGPEKTDHTSLARLEGRFDENGVIFQRSPWTGKLQITPDTKFPRGEKSIDVWIPNLG